jgi:hypothetical protein
MTDPQEAVPWQTTGSLSAPRKTQAIANTDNRAAVGVVLRKTSRSPKARIESNGSTAVGRTNLAALSLIAAIPAAILAVVLVMGFLQHASDMPMMLLVTAGVALLTAACVALTPVGILVFTGPRGTRAAKPAKAAAVAKPQAEEGIAAKKAARDEPAASGELADEGADSAPRKAAPSDAWEAEESEVAVSEAEADEFEFDDNLSSEFDSEFDFEEDEKR